MDLRTLTRACRGFFIGAITQGQKAESGGGVLGEVEQPYAIQLGLWGSAVSSPAELGAVPRPPAEVFPLFSAFMIASPNTIMLLI